MPITTTFRRVISGRYLSFWSSPSNKEFKKSLKLTTKAVVTALENSQDGWHPELQRLYDVIRNLHHEGGPV